MITLSIKAIGELNMKILSYILGGFVALIIILAIISPKEFKLERESCHQST
ncbi:hypothetical protein LEP1GSC170_3269 [Leptospira interrogans serovar Bataviae str. HAI135]|nr:hypothetical protein LEP1GSC170_3269 [Leptospira interrogans serovar Bataviae str. HAI135]